MKHTAHILTAAAFVALVATAAPVRAEEPGMMDNVKMGFSQAIKGVQDWFGDDTPETVEPAAGESGFDVTNDDAMQVPPPVDPSIVEPAAGGMDDDLLQVPPMYMGPDQDSTNTGTPRASAFDGNTSTMAFGDQDTMPTIEDYNAIAPAAGEGTDAAATAGIDCEAINAAATAGEQVEAELIEACANPAPIPAADAAANVNEVPMQEEYAPAQPAFEIQPMPSEPAVAPSTPTSPSTPGELPATQPATGE